MFKFVFQFSARMKKLYVLLIYLVHCVTGEAVTSLGLLNHDETIAPKTCTMERVYKMVGYVCSNLNLKEIPQHLRSSLEVSERNKYLFLCLPTILTENYVFD